MSCKLSIDKKFGIYFLKIIIIHTSPIGASFRYMYVSVTVQQSPRSLLAYYEIRTIVYVITHYMTSYIVLIVNFTMNTRKIPLTMQFKSGST